MNNPDQTNAHLSSELAQTSHQLQVEIQQHKRTADALIESQIRFASILDIAHEAIISIDQAHRIMLFNKGAERIFGYLASEAIDQPLDILLPERFIGWHQQEVSRYAAPDESPRMMGTRREVVGVRKGGQEFPASASISKLSVGEKTIFTVVLRDITDEKKIEEERDHRIAELKALNESVRAITAELDLAQVLQKIADAARSLVRVEFAALGLHDGEGRLSRFITAGVHAADHELIGPLPAGHGLLGHLLHRGQSLIIDDISGHPKSVGFPENHPRMRSLLGVPVFSKTKLIGALYLSNKIEGSKFTEADQQLVEMLAVHAAIAIENAQLYEQTQRLAVLEERERFARDLHDGIIQSIYGVGLALEQAKFDIRTTNYEARKQIELSLKSLASVIKDIRNYIFDLRPQALKFKGLAARLDGLIKELRVNTLLPIQAQIEPGLDNHLTEMQARHIFHIAHEALSNAARHAKASQISLSLTRDHGQVVVVVADDGVGFTLQPLAAPGHHGLVNIKDRADQLNAGLEIKTAPHAGTRLTLTLPLGSPPGANQR
jgi:PAS domain S-box-containing protein